MKGMTAFGKAKKNTDIYQVTVEISSVNRRHAEIVVKLPPGYQEIDSIIRQELVKKIGRGQISVFVQIEPLNAELLVPSLNWQMVEVQSRIACEIGKKLGVAIQMEKVALELWKKALLHEETRDCSMVVPLVRETLYEAYKEFDEKKREEGAALLKDFVARLNELHSYLSKIKDQSKGHVDLVREKITAQLQGIVSEQLISDERIMREIVLQADKADICEELTRIQHHLDHFEKTLKEDQPVGKLLEFVLQELLREFNTLGSKTPLSAVSTLVVLAKTELEKIREQIQNVE